MEESDREILRQTSRTDTSLFSRGKMTKELQSSRYIAISFLVREMGIDIVEAISLMAEFEKSGLVRLESSGDLTLKELGGAL